MGETKLPEICNTWGKTDAESCIDKCYELEFARESDQATEEMWWDVGTKMAGLGGFAGISTLIQAEQQVDAKQEEKFFGAAIAGVGLLGGVIGGIGSSFVDEAHTQENINAQHCEQLSAILMSRQLVSMEK